MLKRQEESFNVEEGDPRERPSPDRMFAHVWGPCLPAGRHKTHRTLFCFIISDLIVEDSEHGNYEVSSYGERRRQEGAASIGDPDKNN